MKQSLKLTAMELGALSVLTLVVAAISITFLLRGCSDRTAGPTVNADCDSISAIIEATRDSNCIAPLQKQKKPRAKRNTTRSERTQPLERNYLDEIADE